PLISFAWRRHPVLPAPQRTLVRLVAVMPGFLAMLAAKRPRFVPFSSPHHGTLSYHVNRFRSTGNFWFVVPPPGVTETILPLKPPRGRPVILGSFPSGALATGFPSYHTPRLIGKLYFLVSFKKASLAQSAGVSLFYAAGALYFPGVLKSALRALEFYCSTA
ncbi:MAG: hypothetical protein ACOY4Q_12945, partial [Bacillota bacterium]